jgi:hypothetical protein
MCWSSRSSASSSRPRRSQVPAFIKEFWRPRYAEFIGKEIQTAYLESYSEYGQNIFDRYVTYADFWIQDQEYRDTEHRRGVRPQRAQRRAGEDREAGRHQQPQGLPQRDRQLRAARPRQQRGKNPSWTSYEKLRAVIEKKMFSNTEDLLPVISFNAKASADDQEARGLRRPHDAEGLHAQAGPPAVRVVPARAQEQLTLVGRAPARARSLTGRPHGPHHRPSVRQQEQERRQPPALPAPLQAADPRSRGRRHRRPLDQGPGQRRGCSIPSRDLSEPQFHHGRGGVWDHLHRQRPVLVGDQINRPQGGGGGGSGKGKASKDGEGEDDFVFNLSREEFLDVFFDDLALPDLVKTQLARIHEYKSQRAGFSNDGTPANINVVRSCAAPWAGGWPSARPSTASCGSSSGLDERLETHPDDDPEVSA